MKEDQEKDAIDLEALAAQIVEGVDRKAREAAAARPAAREVSAPRDGHKYDLARDALAAARTFGSDAIRFVFILNGGALTALLAYLGAGERLGALAVGALVCFAVGALLAGVAAWCAYTAQSQLANRYREWTEGKTYPTSDWSPRASGALVASMIAAAGGIFLAYVELTLQRPSEDVLLEVKWTRS